VSHETVIVEALDLTEWVDTGRTRVRYRRVSQDLLMDELRTEILGRRERMGAAPRAAPAGVDRGQLELHWGAG